MQVGFVVCVSMCFTPVVGKKALFAVGSVEDGKTGTSDVYFKSQIEAAGYTVTLVDDDEVASDTYTAPNDYDLVVVSASTVSTKIADKFKDVSSDFLSWEEGVYDDMGMTRKAADGAKSQLENGAASGYWKKAKPNNDYAYPDNLASITIVSANTKCKLAAGLAGTVAVYSQPYAMSWGVPGADAINIATISTPSYGNLAKSVVFSYNKGDRLADGTVAAGKRVALFPYHFSNGNSLDQQVEKNSPADGTVPLTAAGQKLVTAAIAMDLTCGTPSSNALFAVGSIVNKGNSDASGASCRGQLWLAAPVLFLGAVSTSLIARAIMRRLDEGDPPLPPPSWDLEAEVPLV